MWKYRPPWTSTTTLTRETSQGSLTRGPPPASVHCRPGMDSARSEFQACLHAVGHYVGLQVVALGCCARYSATAAERCDGAVHRRVAPDAALEHGSEQRAVSLGCCARCNATAAEHGDALLYGGSARRAAPERGSEHEQQAVRLTRQSPNREPSSTGWRRRRNFDSV